jgi:hypothetical protein
MPRPEEKSCAHAFSPVELTYLWLDAIRHRLLTQFVMRMKCNSERMRTYGCPTSQREAYDCGAIKQSERVEVSKSFSAC